MTTAAQTLELFWNPTHTGQTEKRKDDGKKWNTTKSGPGFSFEEWRMPAIIETASSAGNVLTFSPVIASYHPHGKIKNNSTE